MNLDYLSKSDRALIILGFQAVFAIFALLFIVFGYQKILANKGSDESLNGLELIQLAIWILSCVLCIVVAAKFQKIADYPKSVEKIDAKIPRLRQKISSNRDQ